ncbi:MAG TPA: hypothetical protein VN154_12985 [Rhizomicrobium sp.]|nr:hypothetical protein [Rhizomicrobium sp.]
MELAGAIAIALLSGLTVVAYQNHRGYVRIFRLLTAGLVIYLLAVIAWAASRGILMQLQPSTVWATMTADRE